MSTTTNFKRIALVAVAALGLGVLSSVPSGAAVNSITLTTGNGSATTAKSDSTTAATVNLSSLVDNTSDTVTVSVVLKSVPAGASNPTPILKAKETSTANSTVYAVATTGGTIGASITAFSGTSDSVTSAGSFIVKGGGSQYIGANFQVFLDTNTATRKAGTYVVTVKAQAFTNGTTLDTAKTVVQDVNIVVAAVADLSTVADATGSKAVLYGDATTFGGDSTQADSTVVSASTPSATAVAVLRVYLKNAAGGNAQESVTVTTDKGLVASAQDTYAAKGTTITANYDALTATTGSSGYVDFRFYPNGQAGKATITVKSTSVTFASKSLSYYATAVSSYGTPKLLKTVISAAANTGVISVVAKDSENNSNSSATAAYAYSSDTSVVSNYGTACAYDSDLEAQVCDLTGVKAGKAKITIRNKSTVALSTVNSTEIEVTVSSGPVTNFKITLDKATYSPGEKATLTVTAVDKDGNSVPADAFTNLFATGGITTSMTLGSASDTTIVSASVTTATSALLGRYTPVKTYTIYMPVNGGTLSFYATGGASLPLAAQVKQTTTVTVTDSGAAALAAVTALATTVASLKTLIVTLTNLVLKIQKKVKA